VHASIDTSLYAELAARFGQVTRLHDHFDDHETHPLHLASGGERDARRLVVPATNTAVARTLTLALRVISPRRICLTTGSAAK
jgi:hypothetical protein